ncbi:MAG: hypothetical protein M1814_000485 [Vezdaea aestivalis]|nr:MAG: hypothetical protein M1814_000485 [Vezdaea aestivalis]
MASQSQTPFTSVSPTVNMRPIYLKMERYTDEELELLLQIRTSNPKAKWKTVASLYNEKATRPRTVQAITNKAKQLQRKQPKWANAMLRAQGARTGDVAPVSWKGLLQGCITDRPLSNKTSKVRRNNGIEQNDEQG